MKKPHNTAKNARNGDSKMSKKIGSTLLAFLLVIAAFATLPSNAFAKSYADQLRDKGFPESYISKLVALHDKYPKWDFQPLKTGLDFTSAVNAERSPHSKQLIERQSSLSSAYYCTCSSCKNKPQEGSSWYSASQNAVMHYMDPRNFFDEKHIFQFESTAYNSAQTKTGVETILSSTWMHNSLINYLTTDGKTRKNYDSKTKYSDAILAAAKNSGMSAYYLASKIVQEVGSTKATTGGASGSSAPFYGIYNYYNIGAYSGAMDGLEWAAGYLRLEENATIYSDYKDGKVSGTKTTAKAGQYMVWRANAGDYYRVRLYTDNTGSYSTGISGYVKKSVCRTKYFNYGRPWSNPYKSIYYGATYIANGFSKTQNTGYLQKFNVAPGTAEKHSHEYMANVQAAASESVTTYNAYKAAKILDTAKTFIIPVYNNMPSSTADVSHISTTADTTTTTKVTTTTANKNQVTGLTLTARTKTSLTYKWNKVSGATKYYIDITNKTKGSNFSKTVTGTSATLNNLTDTQEYAVRVRAYVGGKYGPYSAYNTKHCLPGSVSGAKIKSRSAASVTLKWSKKAGADGYYIYRYDTKTKKTTKVATITGNKTSGAVSKLNANTAYTFQVAAYTKDSKTKTGAKSSKVSTKTLTATPKISSATSTKSKKITLKWGKVTCSGYQVQYSTTKNFKKNFLDFTVSKTATGKTFSTYRAKTTYYVRMRSYRTEGKKKVYSAWSTTKAVKVK